MSGVPKEIPGLGESTLAVRLNPEFDPMGARGLTSESYFVLSRVDGRASLKDLILMTGFTVDKAVGILSQLRVLGALLLPGETPESVRRVTAKRADLAAAELDDGSLSDEERRALDSELEIGTAEKRRILAMRRRISEDYFSVLGLEPDVDRRAVKRAYFSLSKEFHPDRYYGKQIGPFKGWLSEVFEAFTSAYEVLSDKGLRANYEARLRGDPPPKSNEPSSQSKEEHAAQLFDQGCALEVRGDVEGALRLFGAVMRLDPRPSYLRRAARCALGAESLAIAEEYARKAAGLAPRDPSSARILADVLRAADKLEEAEATLQRALQLKSENDVLTAELQEELSQIRKLRETR